VALDGVGELPLVGVRKRTEGVGDGGGQSARIDAGGELGGELAGQGEAALGPCGPTAEEPRDGVRREAVLIDQGKHDARLVHRTGCLLGRVRGEQPGLAGGTDGLLDDAGDGLPPLLDPSGEPLEAVEHLVRAVVVRGDADRERCELCVPVRVGPSERRERGPQGGDRDVDHEVHERASSTGRSW
jgi:hypothetical protein